MINDSDVFVDRLTLGPYETNAYIAVCLKTKESLVVDAPARASDIIASLKGTIPRYILLTHDHFDHTGATLATESAAGRPSAGFHTA
jgi:hydroxyacylglutathione hydrolase